MRTLALLALFCISCSSGVRRFSDRPIVWVDDDARAYSPPPRESYVPYFWDAIDHMVFRPASEVWLLETEREAINVNALDEVPSSSWFVNRIGRRAMSPEEVALGACETMALDPPTPWRIFSGKPDGATPGFMFEDANGDRYVLKVDRPAQPEQSTGAHAVVASIYHAAGYYVPCNRVTRFTRDMLELDPEATVEYENQRERPMTDEHVELVLESARRYADGRYRAVLSRFIDGRPLGPASFRGTRDGDPNDVIPHEHRRELRGMYVLNAWVNHWDARDQNTLSAWIERGNGGYVRHYLIDFDESLGMIEGNDRRARRFGHSQWLDVQHIVEDAVGLGLVQRPWDRTERGPAAHVLGYFDVDSFDPDEWRPDYWNGAFERRTERDEAWMARIVARFSRRHLEALVRAGSYTEPLVERELVRVLAGRQRAILERWLTRLSPLADPMIHDGELCVTDLAVSSGLRWPHDRVYVANVLSGDPLAVVDDLAVRREDARLCMPLPLERGYVIVDVHARTVDAERNGPLRLHLAIGDSARLIGLERPDP